MKDHPGYVTVTYGLRGYFAVLMAWNPDHGGFYEPWNSADFSHRTRAAAVVDAREWALAEGVECRV